MKLCIASVFLFVLQLHAGAQTAFAQESPAPTSGLTVHEWGTFTSVAGAAGKAVEWLPQIGKDDLPSFVEHLGNNRFKGGLRGTVRMETPVLYFYSDQQANVSVYVSFSKGLLTEWYPHAVGANLSHDFLNTPMDLPASRGDIHWTSVIVNPSAAPKYPGLDATGRYFASRATHSSPLLVDAPEGKQFEKFLFYRGVASFEVPLQVTILHDGRYFVTNNGPSPILQMILFDRHEGKVGARIIGAFSNSVIIETPIMGDTLGDKFPDLVEKILVLHGLYEDEAHAMLETWKDSWFEDGTRLIYIVPRSFVDSVLPLHVNPTPDNVVRVFVGRLEIASAATEKDVERAFLTNDGATLEKYGRFLEPILQAMIDGASDPARKQQLLEFKGRAYGMLLAPIYEDYAKKHPEALDSQSR